MTIALSEATTEKADPWRQAAQAFVDEVRQFREEDHGKFAALKRNAGNTLAEARGITWFYHLLTRYAHGYDDDIYFLVATLISLNKHQDKGNLGQTLALLAARPSVNPQSIERRFAILVDSDFDRIHNRPGGGELAFRLRQIVKLAASKEVGFDWAQLLLDLRELSDTRERQRPPREVQKRWANQFYRGAQIVMPDEQTEIVADQE